MSNLFELDAHFVNVLSGKFNALHAQRSCQAVLGAPDPDAAADSLQRFSTLAWAEQRFE